MSEDKNRIGAACWYRVNREAFNNEPAWRGGRLRAWSTDHEEYENGPGLYPVGVVEDDKTLLCHSVRVARICFAAIPPKL